MTMDAIEVAGSVTIWFDGAVPARMLWEGERWRVTDRPTEPEGLYWSTHPPEFAAWRFQATSASGLSRVFDVVRRHDEPHWRVVHIYD